MLLSPGRLPAGLGVTITALVCTGALGTPASAAAEGGSVSASGTTVHFTAAAGAANTVAVTRLGSTIVDDDEVPVEAGRGCRAVPGDDTRVRCLLLDPTLINVSLGDRNDSLTNQTAVAVEATGGDGDDMLNDHAGNDGFYGGAGKDVVTYEFWTEDVVARLGGSGGNGSYVRARTTTSPPTSRGSGAAPAATFSPVTMPRTTSVASAATTTSTVAPATTASTAATTTPPSPATSAAPRRARWSTARRLPPAAEGPPVTQAPGRGCLVWRFAGLRV